ncbi:hypothetical protein T10_13440 [Trichinella papuae]|uniref:Uncharacterized protein n=1 Tax=Trichinella papuae TaxID=268474 RepID=A0A0V1M1W9_9BILA|nr:hypothetical protein T10_13440 [Trichinella papuae]
MFTHCTMKYHLNNKSSEKLYAKIFNYSNAKLADMTLTQNQFCHQPCSFMRNFLHFDQLD